MRFLYPVSAFLVGLLLLGFGIGQLVPGEPQTVRSQQADDAPFTLITDDLIDAEEGHDEFMIEAEGEYSLAIGRAHDVEAWLGDVSYNRITGVTGDSESDAEAQIQVEHVEGEAQAPNPLDSDLWVVTETTEGELLYRWSAPDTDDEWVLLVFRDGEAAAPVTITAERPAPASQGLGVTLVIFGALALLLALALFYRALGAVRRESRTEEVPERASATQAAGVEHSTAAETTAAVSAAGTGGALGESTRAADSTDSADQRPEAALLGEEDETTHLDAVADTAEEEESSGGDTAHGEVEVDLDDPDDRGEAPFDDDDLSAADEDVVSPQTVALPGAIDADPAADLSAEQDADAQAQEELSQEELSQEELSQDELTQDELSADELASQDLSDDDLDQDVAEEDEMTEEIRENAARHEQTGRRRGFRGRFGRGSAFVVVPAVALALSTSLGTAPQAQAETGAPEENQAPEEPQQAENDVEVAEEVPSEGRSVLLNTQMERVLQDISEVVAAADEEQDADALSSRVAGHALEVRELAYRNSELAESALPGPIGTEVLSAAVTSETEFPRQALVITDHPENDVPQVLILEQSSARENYKLIHTSLMAPGTEFPSFTAEQGGVVPVDPQEETEGMSPAQALEGVSAYFADADDDFGDQVAESVYLESLHSYFEELAEAAQDTVLNFPRPEVGEQVTALELPDGSTVVAGSFDLLMQMAPIADGDTIFLDHELVEELAGTDWTTFPTEITSTESVVLQIPAGGEGEIVLLGINDIISDASIETPEWFEGYDND